MARLRVHRQTLHMASGIVQGQRASLLFGHTTISCNLSPRGGTQIWGRLAYVNHCVEVDKFEIYLCSTLAYTSNTLHGVWMSFLRGLFGSFWTSGLRNRVRSGLDCESCVRWTFRLKNKQELHKLILHNLYCAYSACQLYIRMPVKRNLICVRLHSLKSEISLGHAATHDHKMYTHYNSFIRRMDAFHTEDACYLKSPQGQQCWQAVKKSTIVLLQRRKSGYTTKNNERRGTIFLIISPTRRSQDFLQCFFRVTRQTYIVPFSHRPTLSLKFSFWKKPKCPFFKLSPQAPSTHQWQDHRAIPCSAGYVPTSKRHLYERTRSSSGGGWQNSRRHCELPANRTFCVAVIVDVREKMCSKNRMNCIHMQMSFTFPQPQTAVLQTILVADDILGYLLQQ